MAAISGLVLLTSATVVVLIVISNWQYAGQHIEHDCSEGNCYHYSHYIGNPWPLNWFIRTVSSIEAFWTALASSVGVMALWGIYAQIVATREATSETRRSVDHFKDAGRGVAFIGSITAKNADMFGVPAPAVINCNGSNGGSDPVFITDVMAGYRVFGSVGEIDAGSIDTPVILSGVAIPVPAGGDFGSTAMSGTRIPIHMDVRDENKDIWIRGMVIAARYVMRYRTQFGEEAESAAVI